MAIGLVEPFNEIHGYGRPWSLGDGEEAERPIWFVADCLCSPTSGTGAHIAVHILRHVRPIVAPAQHLGGFCDTWVTGQVVVMTGLKECEAEFVVVWDVEGPLPQEVSLF